MKLATAVIATVLLAGACAPLPAQDAKMAALFVLNFGKYIDWPAAALESTCVITVLGDDPIYDNLKPLAEAAETVGRRVMILKVSRLENISKTHILYISPDKSNQLGSAVARFTPAHTLLVTQKPGLAREGAGINLTTANGKLSYEINAENIKKAGLEMKPALLKLGRLVD